MGVIGLSSSIARPILALCMVAKRFVRLARFCHYGWNCVHCVLLLQFGLSRAVLSSKRDGLKWISKGATTPGFLLAAKNLSASAGLQLNGSA
jgi:hypothetical protein